MITKINHIGIAVNSIDGMLKLYTGVLGLKLGSTEVLPEQKVKTAIINIGESKIELLESTAPDGPIARHIEKRGEGLHHLALETDDVQSDMKMVAAKGLTLIDQVPRRGVEGTTIVFLHPKDTRVLLELVQAGSK
ncbi:MAG: methylmalonyl-CoA epimerase [Chloroflexi bacterium]|nr:methylmalonyl-CoA epimerase [Chloroflexota bacterium]